MKKITLGLIAHVDSGKTTLSEALLHSAGAIRTFGRVDKGESFLDGAPLERKRGITIYSKQAMFEYGDMRITLMDTPGHSDFSAELERVLQILDYALLIISAPDGITLHTKRLWEMLEGYDIPTFIFFNKMDRCDASHEDLIINARSELADGIMDFSSERDEDFYEQAAFGSEAAMEEFLKNGSVRLSTITEMIAERQIFPAFFGSALRQEGIEEILSGMDELMLETEYPQEFGARVFKIMRDASGSRLTFLKVTGGSLKNKSSLPDGDGQSKINRIRGYSGSRYELVPECFPGDVCAVEGLDHSFAGQGFGYESERIYPLSVPVAKYTVILPEGADPRLKLADFRLLEEENPEISVEWNEEWQEIYVSLTGTVQMEVLLTVLKERFDLEVSFVPYEPHPVLMDEELAEVSSEDEEAEDTDEITGFIGTDEVDRIIAGISRNAADRRGWKKKRKKSFGIAEGMTVISSAMHGTGNIRSVTKIFEPETADYLIVDGYNVIFAWEDLNELASENLDAARISLQEKLCNWQALTGSEVIVVFDAYKVPGHNTEISDYLNIHVVFTREAETADQYIEKFASEHGKKQKVAVVTSDGLEQIIIRGEGCALISSREFQRRLENL